MRFALLLFSRVSHTSALSNKSVNPAVVLYNISLSADFCSVVVHILYHSLTFGVAIIISFFVYVKNRKTSVQVLSGSPSFQALCYIF